MFDLSFTDKRLHFLSFYRLVKLSLPNYGDFELIFSQIQQFITICSKEQIQFAGEKCKYLLKQEKGIRIDFICRVIEINRCYYVGL